MAADEDGAEADDGGGDAPGAKGRATAGRATAVDHIGVAVEDVEAAADLFSRLLGLHVEGVEEVPGEEVRVAFLPVGESRIELLEPTSDESPIAPFLESRGEGLHQVAVRVDDIDAAVARAEAMGVRVLGEVREGAGGMRVTFLHPKDCHGVLVELVERA